MTYHEAVVSTKQGRVVSITNQLILKQPWKVSNVQQEQQWTKNTTLWHTRYDINTRTTHNIYLNSLSTTGQKILEHLQDQATNSSFPQFKHKAPMINPVKGRTEINPDERKLFTPCLIPTDQNRRCPEEHHRYPNPFCMNTGEMAGPQISPKSDQNAKQSTFQKPSTELV